MRNRQYEARGTKLEAFVSFLGLFATFSRRAAARTNIAVQLAHRQASHGAHARPISCCDSVLALSHAIPDICGRHEWWAADHRFHGLRALYPVSVISLRLLFPVAHRDGQSIE